jgi:hypothetical protein
MKKYSLFEYSIPSPPKKAWWILSIAFCFTILLSSGVKYLRFDYDFEKFFPADDPESVFFRAHRKKFESDNDFLLIAIERKKGIFHKEFLKKIDRLSHQIETQVPFVTTVASITKAEEVRFLPFGIAYKQPFIHFSGNLKQDSIKIYRSEELLNSLIAKDGRSVCIYVRHEDYLVKKKSDQMLAKIDALIKPFNFDGVHIAGRTIGQKRYVEKMVHEMFFFLALSAVMVLVFLLITYRSVWGVVIPSIVIGLSTACLLGLMGWLSIPINILLITLPTILFIVAMSDVIHVVSRYLDALRDGLTKPEAIRITVKEVGFSAFLTSVTTAIGFGTLYFVNMEPIQVFGIVTAIGVVIAFLLTMLLLPALFIIFPSPKLVKQKNEGTYWNYKLRKWFFAVLRNRKKVLGFYAVLTIICLWGTLHLKGNNYLIDDLRQNDSIKVDFNFLDKHYGGIRPFELVVRLKDDQKSFWNKQMLKDLDRIEDYLEKEYGAEVKLSVAGFCKVVQRGSNQGDPKFYEVPERTSDIRRCKKYLSLASGGKLLHSLIDSTGMVTRIHGNLPDLGNTEISKRNTRLMRFLKEERFAQYFDCKITGTAHLFDRNVQFLTRNLVEGLAIEILLLALLMGLVYRSFTMILIFMIPNIIPLLIIAGLMTILHIDLKTSTAIIFTVALGIAVDDTIHLLGKFKYEIAKGNSVIRGLKTSYLTTVKATILTTFILCAGFMLLMFSSFVGSFNMGLLISLTLFVAMLIEITLLPVLIIWLYRKR